MNAITKLRNEAEIYVQEMHLNTEEDRQIVRNCISKYALPESFCDRLTWVVFRVINAIKSLFSGSSWQVAKKVIEDRLRQGIVVKTQEAVAKNSVVMNPQNVRELTLSETLSEALRDFSHAVADSMSSIADQLYQEIVVKNSSEVADKLLSKGLLLHERGQEGGATVKLHNMDQIPIS